MKYSYNLKYANGDMLVYFFGGRSIVNEFVYKLDIVEIFPFVYTYIYIYFYQYILAPRFFSLIYFGPSSGF